MDSTQLEYVKFIISQIRKGKTDPKDVVGLFCTKFGKTRSTFYNYWSIADKQHAEAAKKAKEATDKIYINAEEEAAREGLNDKNKLARILWENITRLRQLKSGKITEGFEPVVPRDEISAKGEIRANAAAIASLYDLSKDNDKGGNIQITINADGITLKSDDI